MRHIVQTIDRRTVPAGYQVAVGIDRKMTPPLLSVVVPIARPALDLDPVLRSVDRALSEIGASAELIVSGRRVAGRPEDVGATPTYIAAADGYGPALRAGLEAATGQYVMTIDPECGGIADAMHRLWDARERGEVIVGSRYVTGAEARMSLARRIGSRTVNQVFNRGLSLSVRDLSSAFRLYRADVLRDQPFAGRDYDLLPEILVRTLTGGWRVCEVPLRLDVIRRRGSVQPLLRLVRAYARTFGSLWKLRNSIQAADYDARAHDSIIPLQRYWQRTRYRHVTDLIRGHGAVLDVGCGSSKIIGALPPGSVSLDVLPNKLRYARRFTTRCVRASGFHLPFADGSFPCVLCSQVIEHVPADSPILGELVRVLAPGGRLVLGTPDYDQWQWVYLEKAYGFFKPGGYAEEHITHYSRRGLLQYFGALGFRHEATRYILRGELILAFTKPA